MKFKGTPQQGLFGATLGFFIGFAAVSLFGPTAKKLQDLMQLTPMMVGFLVAMPSLSGSLLRIPFAAWVDTTGGRKPFLVLLVTSVIGMVGLTAVIFLLYPDRMTRALYPLLLLLGLLSGCGIATFSVGIGQVSYWFPQCSPGRGARYAFAGIGNLAPGIFSLLLPLALGAWGLSGSYLAWLVFLIAGTVLYFYTGRNAWYFQAREQGQT
jgi:MFS transporter, NNP family, nitrate/nitrite transporter